MNYTKTQFITNTADSNGTTPIHENTIKKRETYIYQAITSGNQTKKWRLIEELGWCEWFTINKSTSSAWIS